MTTVHRTELEAKKVPELMKLVKATGLPYKKYGSMKKAELIDHLMTPAPLEIKGKDAEHQEIRDQTKEFEDNGGEIQQMKPQKNKPRIPHTEKSAENNPKKARKIKKKSDKKGSDKKAPKKAPETDTVSLQDILDQVGIAGPKARKLLRGSGLEKPGKQWVWEKGDKGITKVTDFLKLAAGLSREINSQELYPEESV